MPYVRILKMYFVQFLYKSMNKGLSYLYFTPRAGYIWLMKTDETKLDLKLAVP